MTRHIEFGHDPDTAIARVGDNFPDFPLGVIKTAGCLPLQERVLLALDMEPFIIRKAPMKHVELDRLHAVEIALDHRNANETMAGIDEQTAPGKAGSIRDRNNWNGEALRRHSDQLKKRLQAVHHPEGIRGS